MNHTEIGEIDQRFLIALFEKTSGNPAAEASMYEIGLDLGLDKYRSKQVAENLIGWELIEIRTLAGSIAITTGGVDQVQQEEKLSGASDDIVFELSNGPTLKETVCKRIDQILAELKIQAGNLGLDFDTLTEYVADLKTIESQLLSSRPKTAIVKACFFSIRDILEKAKAPDSLLLVKKILGKWSK